MLNRIALVFACSLVALGAVGAQEIRRVSVQPTAPTSGKDMFAEYCAVCHGTSGRGDGPAATALRKHPADLTQLSRKNGGQFPEIRVLRFIKGSDEFAAHGTRDMPVWGEVLRSLDAAGSSVVDLRVMNLERYIESFQAQ